MPRMKGLILAKFRVCHDFNTIKDSFGCSKKVHTICYNFAYSSTWEANFGIWFIKGVVFVAKGQKHPIETFIMLKVDTYDYDKYD